MPNNRNHGQKWIRNTRRCAIYARDRFMCVYCEEPGKRLLLDHVEPFGGNESDNLVSACWDCNGEKGDKSLDAWLLHRRAVRGDEASVLLAIRQRVAVQTFLPPDMELGRALEARRPRGGFEALPGLVVALAARKRKRRLSAEAWEAGAR
jgi:hypothetical protein